jgi:clan AA aspartic protease
MNHRFDKTNAFVSDLLMSLAKAKAIGRKRRRLGQLWPMPIRETDLGHTYAEITVRPLGGSAKSWTGRALVDTGATDTFLPASVLRKLGIRPAGRRSYELADGSEQELPIGFGVIEVLGREAGGTLAFAGENEVPLLGVTVLESAGFWIDPQRERLVPRPPMRKRRR